MLAELAAALKGVALKVYGQLCTKQEETPCSNKCCTFYVLKLLVAMVSIQGNTIHNYVFSNNIQCIC